MSPGLGTAALALWRAGLATGQSYDPAWAEKVYSSGALSGFLSPCTRRKPSSNGVVSAVRKSRASRRSFLTRQERQFIISYCGYCIVRGAAEQGGGAAEWLSALSLRLSLGAQARPSPLHEQCWTFLWNCNIAAYCNSPAAAPVGVCIFFFKCFSSTAAGQDGGEGSVGRSRSTALVFVLSLPSAPVAGGKRRRQIIGLRSSA